MSSSKSSNHAVRQIARFKNARVAIFGDVILDHYLFGRAKRLSSEAPIPIVDLESEQFCLGGAANVGLNLFALGARAHLFSVVGDDAPGRILIEQCTKNGVSVDHILIEPRRITSHKMRLVAMGQQLSRVDHETVGDISSDSAAAMLRNLDQRSDEFNAIIIQDYNKGVLAAQTITEVIKIAKRAALPVFVDPKFSNIDAYRGTYLFKPNRRELSAAYGKSIDSEDTLKDACYSIKDKLDCQIVVATLSEDGMAYLDAEGHYARLQTVKRDVRDTSGAGDTVISNLTAALVTGGNLHVAASIASHAACIVCGKLGTATASPEEISESILLERRHSSSKNQGS